MSYNNAKEEDINFQIDSINLKTPQEKKIIDGSNNFDFEGPERFNKEKLSVKDNFNKKEDQDLKNNNPYVNDIIKNESNEELNNNNNLGLNKKKEKKKSYNETNNQNNEQNLNNLENEKSISKNYFDNYFNNQQNENNNNCSNKNKINANDNQESASPKEGKNLIYSQKSNNNKNSNNINSNNVENNINNYNNNLNNINKNNPYKNISSKDNSKIDFKDLKTFFSIYKKDPRTALYEWKESSKIKNDTSYLNAVLQLIGHIPNFAFYFLNPENQHDIEAKIKRMPLAFVTERLFIHLYPYPEKMHCEVYNTHNYLKVLSTLNMIYDTDITQKKDPNDLISFILDTLDKEINGKFKSPKNYDKYNANEVIKEECTNFAYNIISKDLNWFQLNEAKCQNCKKSMFKVISFNTFNLDISKCYNIIQNGNKEISLKECLHILFSQPIIQKLRCDSCNNSFQKITTCKKILNAPKTFIFLLERGINFDPSNQLLKIHFKIEEEIDLSDFIIIKKSSKYILTGIVSIFLEEKKYISYCISPITKEWYYYNDEKVEYTNLYLILKKHQNNENIPCILMYSAIN